MTRPKLLDLFCGAGGAGMGYYRAGFDVVGVDIKPQKNYPLEFHQGDALEYLVEHGKEFDVIHASPPCQKHSAMTKGRWQDRLDGHINLIPDTRRILIQSGKPYIIENVPGAKGELINPIMLCGTMFGLIARNGAQLRRHRLFETRPTILFPPATCKHNRTVSAIGVYGGGQHPNRRRPSTIGVYGNSGGSSNRDGTVMFGIEDRRCAMGINWMTGTELSQAIPPAYTEWLGKQILEAIE